MGYSKKLKAGATFPVLEATKIDGTKVKLGQPQGEATWQAVFVYRGKHCPLCTKYLNEIETYNKLKSLPKGIINIRVYSTQKDAN